MNRVIALAGQKGSGKSTIAKWLIDTHRYTEVSLADKLKDVARSLFPTLTYDACHGPSAKREQPFTPQQVRQLVRELMAAQTYLRLDPDGRELLKDLFSAAPQPQAFDARDMAGMLSVAVEPLEEGFKSPRTVLQRLGTEWGRKIWDEVWLYAVRKKVTESKGESFVIADCRFANEAQYLRDNLGAQIWWVNAGDRIANRPADNHASEPQRADLIVYCAGELTNTVSLAELPSYLQRALG